MARLRAPVGDFDDARPAPDCLDQLTAPVADAVRAWQGDVPADQLPYVDTDPEIADTALSVEHHGRALLDTSANCVVVAGKRGGETRLAAGLVPSGTRAETSTASCASTSAPARRRSRRWTPRPAAPAWSTAGSPRSACPPGGRCSSTPRSSTRSGC